jgi:hypothetical protein
MNKVHYTLEILPAVPPEVRREIEGALESAGYEIIGGGQNTDMSGTDISFEEAR